jgi:TrmH family RNA methyltransferase
VEGPKVVQEFIDSNYELVEIFSINNNYAHFEGKLTIIDEKELKKISSHVTPNTVLAVFKIPTPIEVNANGLILALDELNNPGNLGTIIRLCDWFGIKDLVCSTKTVDCYNSKTVQAAMGSHTRVNIIYLDLELFLDTQSYTMGTFIDTKASIYEMELPSSGVVVFGNEANGISDAIASKLNTRLAIPRFGLLKQTESLNVANAAAIVLSEFKRRSIER